MENKRVGEFLYFKYFPRVYVNFSIVQVDRPIKRKPIEIKENADTALKIGAFWLTLYSYLA